MRRIKKNFLQPPVEVAKFAEKNMEKMLAGDDNPIHRIRTLVKPHLELLYLNKCAYCESYIGITGFSRIDHYRPTAKYRWLSLEWSNLVISCEKCNHYKSDSFPLQDEKKRMIKPSSKTQYADSPQLVGEEPLLLNPELDDPSEHITYCPNGTILEKNSSKRGRETIAACKLNRHVLKVEYKRQINKILKAIKIQSKNAAKFINMVNNDEIRLLLYIETFTELKELQNPGNKYAYTQLGTQMVEDFENFFVCRLPGNEDMRDMVRKAFALFKKRYLDYRGKHARNFKRD